MLYSSILYPILKFDFCNLVRNSVVCFSHAIFPMNRSLELMESGTSYCFQVDSPLPCIHGRSRRVRTTCSLSQSEVYCLVWYIMLAWNWKIQMNLGHFGLSMVVKRALGSGKGARTRYPPKKGNSRGTRRYPFYSFLCLLWAADGTKRRWFSLRVNASAIGWLTSWIYAHHVPLQ